MLYRKIIAIFFQSHTQHIKTPCGQKVKFFNDKAGGTYSSRWAVKL
jgi:hypothetical protein